MPLDKALVGVFYNTGDGCTYWAETCKGIFDDLDKAKACAEQTFKNDFPLMDNEHLEWDDMTCHRVWSTGHRQENTVELEFIEINKIR